MAALHLPEELLEDIFSRVPVKSVLRFKTASKKWYSLLSQNHKFANFHLKQSKNHLMLFQNILGETISLNIDTKTLREFNFPVEIATPCELIGSANGLICVAPCRKGGCFIWNPCTGECKKISLPIPTASSRVFGFGYDSCSDDYKIVADWGSHFQIFSLKTNSWKILEYSFRMRDYAFHFYGALHWFLNEEILAFDLAKEVFSYIELPDEMDCPLRVFLGEYQGLLCLLGAKSIWVMKKYSDGKSWVKLSTFVANQEHQTLGEVVYQFAESDIQATMSDDDKLQMIYVLSQFAFTYTESLISPRCFDCLHFTSAKMKKRTRKQRKTTAT